MLSPVLFSGAFLGWSLGANDAANIFGTAVGTKVVKYWTAVILIAIFLIAGALIDGHAGINKLSGYSYNGGITTPALACMVMLAAAITVTLMTILKMPVSATQAVMGAIIGGGVLAGKADFGATTEFFGAWFATPIGAMIIGFCLLKLFELFLEKRIKNLVVYDWVVKIGYYAAGIFGAYSLGANNVANVTSIFAGKLNMITADQAVLIGGISIALGVLTFSKPVMSTVGGDLVPLTAIAGFISVLAASSVVYIYALIGIPVSTSQAIVGAVVGIGLTKGINTINKKILRNILFAWFGTPTIAMVLSIIFIFTYQHLF